ncbi:hypothetical protein KJ742_07740 [Patescibacteria group bacterium]|nr:hypothetical protein [Patescibacteria group bacterium]MBU1683803.1 hypothetical protein [Patescibacteria group bacterium]
MPTDNENLEWRIIDEDTGVVSFVLEDQRSGAELVNITCCSRAECVATLAIGMGDNKPVNTMTEIEGAIQSNHLEQLPRDLRDRIDGFLMAGRIN